MTNSAPPKHSRPPRWWLNGCRKGLLGHPLINRGDLKTAVDDRITRDQNNTFKDVANNNLGTGNASTHVIEFAADDSQSIGDAFERPDGDVVSTKRRVSADTSKKTSFAIESSGVKLGGYVRDYGQVETLDDNSTKDSTISFADNTDFAAIEIDYYITRGTTKRQGILRITHDATAQAIDDEFSESNGDAGVTFLLTNSSNITKLRYTTTSTGAAATFNRSIRIIR